MSVSGTTSPRAVLRVLGAQTRANFIWYFWRDSEMIFWSLAIPVFFLFVFSFALGGGGTRGTSTFLVPGLIGAQVLSSGFWGVGAMLAPFAKKTSCAASTSLRFRRGCSSRRSCSIA